MAYIMAATLLPFPFMRKVTPSSGENSAEMLNRFRRKWRRNEPMHNRENHMAASQNRCLVSACIERISRPRMVRKLSLVQGNISIFIEELNPELKSQDTKMKKAVEVEQKVGLFLYFITSTASYRTLSDLFGLPRGFVYICIRKVAAAVVRKLKPKYLSIAKGDELALVIANYKEKWGFPCVLEQSMAHIYQFQHHSKIMQVTTTGNGTTVL